MNNFILSSQALRVVKQKLENEQAEREETIAAGEKYEERYLENLATYKVKIESELSDICTEILNLLKVRSAPNQNACPLAACSPPRPVSPRPLLTQPTHSPNTGRPVPPRHRGRVQGRVRQDAG